MSSANNRGKQAEKSHAKQYLILGIVIALVVGALIVWNNWPQHPNEDAVKIGEQTFGTDEVQYYYTQAYNNTWQTAKMFEQYGMSSGYDTTRPPQEQIYQEETGKTYADYFRETALNQLQQVALLKDQAKKNNYTLSEEGKAAVDAQMKSIESQILQLVISQGGSEKYYLKAMYGENMTKSLLKSMLTDAALADEYTKHVKEEFKYEPAQLTAYYEQNAAELDSYDFNTFFVAANPEAGVDETGKALEPTEEQTAAAMKLAKETADAMAKEVKRGTAFNAAAQQFAPEDQKATYADGTSTLTKDAQGSTLTNVYGTWLKDGARKAGQVEVMEQSGNGYYVVQFLAREKRDNSFETLDVSSILVTAETTTTTDDKGNQTTAPTEDQLAAAKTKAEDLLAQYTSGSDKSSEAFLALGQNAKDTAITTASEPKLTRTTYQAAFDQWAFVPGAVKIGDINLLEVKNTTGATIGYRLVLVNGFGQPRWEYAALSALQDADYTTWFEGEKANYPIEELKGMNQIGVS